MPFKKNVNENHPPKLLGKKVINAVLSVNRFIFS